jgi:hypothetical protein
MRVTAVAVSVVAASVVASLGVVARRLAGRRVETAPIQVEIVLGRRVMARTTVGPVVRLATGLGIVTVHPSVTSRLMWLRMVSPLSC